MSREAKKTWPGTVTNVVCIESMEKEGEKVGVQRYIRFYYDVRSLGTVHDIL